MPNQPLQQPRNLPKRNAKRKRSPSPSDASSGNSLDWERMDVDASSLGFLEEEHAEQGEECLLVEKAYCNFCGDHIGEQINACKDCGAYMCEQKHPDGLGCILVGSLKDRETFRCAVCEPRSWRKLENPPSGEEGCMPYAFIGYSGRRRAKLTWPMVFISATLGSLWDKYLVRAIPLDLAMHYLNAPQNLCTLAVELKTGGETKAKAAMDEGVSFVERSIASEVPANAFIVLDTHSQGKTGGLQWGGSDDQSKHSRVSEVIDKFIGRKLLSAINMAAEIAQRSKPPSASQKGWYDDSVFSRGGWRGLLLATCAPVMRVEDSYRDVKCLVERNDFDFVLGYAGSSTLTINIRYMLSQVVERIGVDRIANIWDTILRVVANDFALLEANNVVVVYRERGSNEVLTRVIARHSPPLRPWGVEFRACGRPGCDRRHSDFFVQNDGFDARMTCRWCGWRSAWVKERHWKQHVFRLDSTLPNVFWHSYPPSHSLQNIFVEVTRENEKGKGVARAAHD